MEELEYTSVETLLNQMKPSPFSSWSCSREVEEQLDKLSPKTMIKVYGSCRYRLADDYPSYYVTQILVTNQFNNL